MPRVVQRCLVAILLSVAATPGPRAAAADGVDVPALVARVEPSMVAIFIVRGEPYAEPSPGDPGRLGAFPSTTGERQAVLRKPELAPHHAGFVPTYVASGAILDRSGLVLTLYHAVRGARKLYVVASDGRQSYADVHAADPRSDWAVLRLLTVQPPWPAMPLGQADALKKGEGLLALELPQPATTRRVDFAASWSRLARRYREPDSLSETAGEAAVPGYFGAILQTDGSSAGASSGGALANARGELVGLTNKLVLARQRAGLAVQAIDEMGRRIVEAMLRGEEVEYGFLGVTTRAVKLAGRDGPTPEGLAISADVLDGTPAARAQLRRGDVILHVQGRPLRGNADLFWAIGPGMAGVGVDVEILRDGQRLQMRVDRLDKLAPVAGVVATTRPPDLRGLRVDFLSTLLGQLPPERLDWQERLLAGLAQGGVVVREVDPDSPAARAGLRTQEFITHLNDRPVASPAQFRREAAGTVGPVTVTVWPLDPLSPARKLRIE
jgi:S1-C subfamily serine protease